MALILCLTCAVCKFSSSVLCLYYERIFYYESLSLNLSKCFILSEAVVRRCSAKEVFLEISQNSQENSCARDSFLIKLSCRPRPPTLFKKNIWHRSFPVNFAKFLRTPFSQHTSNGGFCFFYDPKHL